MRFLLSACCILLLAAGAAHAQPLTRAQQIAAAVTPAPEELQAGATVLGYENGKLVTFRKGTNELICLADQPDDDRFHVACYHEALEPFMARGRRLAAMGMSREEIQRIREAEAMTHVLEMPKFPAALYSLTGPADSFDPEAGTVTGASKLYVVYIPYATAESTGLTTTPAPGVPWLMNPGKPWAHIMLMPASGEDDE